MAVKEWIGLAGRSRVSCAKDWLGCIGCVWLGRFRKGTARQYRIVSVCKCTVCCGWAVSAWVGSFLLGASRTCWVCIGWAVMESCVKAMRGLYGQYRNGCAGIGKECSGLAVSDRMVAVSRVAQGYGSTGKVS